MRFALPWVTRVFDIRRADRRPLAQAFALLFLIVTALTVLETARDALVLTRLPARTFGVLYAASAACVLPAATLTSRSAERFGIRRSLGGVLIALAMTIGLLFAVPTTSVTVVAVYASSGLIGAVGVPQLWSLVGSAFTVAEGRRLLGLIGAGGILGGAVGSIGAAALLAFVRVKALLVVSSGLLIVASFVLVAFQAAEPSAPQPPMRAEWDLRSAKELRTEPFLRRIALLAVVSTAALVTLDYFFKWTVAQTVPRELVARFVARYYAALNGAALVMQVLVSGALVRRIGVAATIAVTPLLLLSGAIGAMAGGGVLVAALVLKGLDGTLRNSVHRIASELLYLPVPEAARARAKPLIDGVVVRGTQAATGAVLFALGEARLLSPSVLAACVVGLTVAWLVAGIDTRRPYLGLLRRSIPARPPDSSLPADPLDLESAETLVQNLAHEDPLVVVGAMNALERRGRARLIPALVLLHPEERILLYALKIFAASEREDWVGRARVLLKDERASIRMAVGRALAMHGRFDATDLAGDDSARARAYVAVHVSLESGTDDPLDEPAIAEVIGASGDTGEEGRLGLLAAVADAPQSAKLSRLLAELETRAGRTREWTEGLARAASSQQAAFLIPALLGRLTLREAREPVRTALVGFDRRGLEAVREALHDPALERRLRIQLPSTLARFGTREAAEALLEVIEGDRDGLVRYRAVRGLGNLVADQRLAVDRARVERMAYTNLVEHFRLLGLCAAFEPSRAEPPSASGRPPTLRLLVGLLDDKMRHSLERAFRLLKIAHPLEDFHGVHIASLSDDKRARANAGEFLDTFLSRQDQQPLRVLLRAVTDDLPMAQRVVRAGSLITKPPPTTAEEALVLLTEDADATVAALAKLHAATVAGKSARVVIGSRHGTPIELSTNDARTAGKEEGGGARV